MLKKKMTKVLTGVLALSMLSGCCSESKMAMESAYDTAASNYSAAGGVYYDSGDYEYAEEVSEENGSSQAETVEKGETTGRKLIRNVDMDVETESFDALLASAQSQAESCRDNKFSYRSGKGKGCRPAFPSRSGQSVRKQDRSA